MDNLNFSNYSKILYKLANKSYKKNEIPVGAIVILNNKIIGKGFNNRQNNHNVCGHAEINAIIDAEKYLKDWRIEDCILISTLKPCKMCFEVINSCRIRTVYYLMNQENLSYDCNNYLKVNYSDMWIKKIESTFKDFFKKLR